MSQIHSSSQIHPTASIGPFSVIGPDVSIGENCVIESHVVIKGPTKIGKNNHFYQFSSIGEGTPDLKYKGEPTELIIGDNNVFREYSSVHRGTIQDQGRTLVGSHNLIMTYAHIAHDCTVGDHCILSNNSAIAGHVTLGDWAIISASSAAHQFCRIGSHAFVGAFSAVFQDVPPYTTVHGSPAVPRIINKEGLKRRGFEKKDIRAIQNAFQILYKRDLTVDEACEQIAANIPEFPVLQIFHDSITESKRKLVR